jgi:hypothetical protein
MLADFAAHSCVESGIHRANGVRDKDEENQAKMPTLHGESFPMLI